VLGSRSARAGERKQVTIVFVDVKGSVRLSAQVDSEEWHRVMDRFFAIASDAIHRFGGTLNQYTGDGVMALFGAPVAHEDHAHRAGLAALALRERAEAYRVELQRERGVDFAVRIGIHSGDVVVGSIGDDLRRDYTAQGYSVGIAARVQGLTPPGEVWMTEAGVALTGGFFEVEDAGLHELEGVRAPIRLFRLIRAARSRGTARGGAPVRLVGREQELARLEAAIDDCRRGRGRTLGIVAEAGVGKSRLCAELIARCVGRRIDVYDAYCCSHGESRPYLPIIELARGALGVQGDEPTDSACARVERRLAALDPDLVDVLPVVLDFLELAGPSQPAPPLDPAARRRLLLALLQALVDEVGAAGPAVVVIDDFHWIDEASADLLGLLVEAVETRPLLLVVAFRPGFRAPWMDGPSYEQIGLAPLPVERSRELVQELLGHDSSLVELAARVSERSGGNALFAEEMVASLAASGVLTGTRGDYVLARSLEEVEVPPTVHAVLAARVDRFSDVEKHVLQASAVIGRPIDAELVASMVDLDAETAAAALGTLHRAQVISIESVYPRSRYVFRHPLLREVTYRSQLREQRARMHAAVALRLAQSHGREPGPHAEAIAFHFEEAGDVVEAARWLRRLGGWLASRDLKAALATARRVRELLERAPESPEVLRLRLSARTRLMGIGYQMGLPHTELEAMLREAEELAERGAPGADRERAILYSSYGQSHLHAGDIPGAIRETEQAASFAKRSGDVELEHSLATFVVFLLRSTGQLREALAVAEQALARAGEHHDWGLRYVGHRVRTLLIHRRGALFCDLGRAAEGLKAMQEAALLAREQDESQLLCWQASDRVWLAERVGPTKGIVELSDEALQIAERRGSDSMLAQALGARGAALRIAGRYVEAIAQFERALAVSSEGHVVRIYDPQCWAGLAEALHAERSESEARSALAAGLESAARLGAPPQQIRVEVARARLALGRRPPDVEEACSAIERAEALAERMGAALWLPALAELRAGCAEARGDAADRDAALGEAAAAWRAMGDPERAQRATTDPIHALEV
jgi:adenylate cyclase